MAKKTTTTVDDHHAAAVSAATEAAAEATTQLDSTQASLAAAETARDELRARNLSGDDSVSGMDIVQAQAQVDAIAGLLSHAESVHASAEAARLDAIAEQAAAHIRSALPPLADVDAITEKATAAVAAAIAGLIEALENRDHASDEAGKALAAAGVAEGQWREGVRWLHSMTSSGRKLTAQYDVQVKDDHGNPAWIARRSGLGHTQREADRLIGEALTAALRHCGRKWTHYGITVA